MNQQSIYPPPAAGRILLHWQEIAAALRHHGLLLAAAAAVLGIGKLLSVLSGHTVPVSILVFIRNYVIFAAMNVLTALIVWKFLRMVVKDRPPSPSREMLRWLRADVFSGRRLFNGLFGMTAILLLIAGFTQAKNTAIRFEGYNWDRTWEALDRVLHFGALPQDLLWPLLGNPWVTRGVDLVYVTWYPVLFAALLVGAFQPERSLERHRYLLAVILTFGIGGCILAAALSSAGPVYFGRITGGPDPYAAHMEQLAEIARSLPLRALEIQQSLWEEKAGGGSSLISAMPSMHVAVAALIAMALWRFGGPLRAASLAFAAMVVLGSIHLGWHYAVDAYAGIVIAGSAWMVALPVSRWYLRRIGEARPD